MKKRFEPFLSLNSGAQDEILVSASHPLFKLRLLRHLCSEENIMSQRKEIEEVFLNAIIEMNEDGLLEHQNKSHNSSMKSEKERFFILLYGII